MPPTSPVLTVASLTALIKGQLEGNFAEVWVEGEISGYKLATSGHAYFSLKDAQAQISCTLWRSQVSRLRFAPKDGLRVLARGSVTVYEPRGTYNLNVQALEPRGVGDLQLAFEQLKARLAAEGLFDKGRKRPLPSLATRIGIVTSPTGAALQDMLRIIHRRFPNTTVVVAPAKVQGVGAAQEVARGIELLNRYGELDVIIVGRGGGSIEDLWAFNEEVVARAIVASALPVVSAVGHEIDFTIADFAADLRAPTPSAAAEQVTRVKAELEDDLRATYGRLQQAMMGNLRRRKSELMGLTERVKDPSRKLAEQQETLQELDRRLKQAMSRGLSMRRKAQEGLEGRLALLTPARKVALARARLEGLAERLERGERATLQRSAGKLALLAGRLDALSPLGVLGRGYAIAQKAADGKVIQRSSQVSVGEAVRVRLGEGSLQCRVTGVEGAE